MEQTESTETRQYMKASYEHNPVAFIDDHIKLNERGRPFKLMPHQREVLRLAFQFDQDGRLAWDTIIYSCPKKSGKTTINAAVTLWWAMTQPADEVFIVANDRDQAIARVFKAMVGLIRFNPKLRTSAEVQRALITLSNDTEISAVACDYAGAAGSNHGLTSWDELWAYISESSHRLWEELTPVPTRENSVRFVTTYAGWEGESELLHQLYKQAVTKDEHPDGQGERIHPDLPIYANKEAGIFAYWDHERRLPWQQREKYYAGQKQKLRTGTYLRLHENRWTTAEETFITPELWDPCVDDTLSPISTTAGRKEMLFVGVDAGIKNDTAAVVAVRWEDEKLCLAYHRIWRPSRSVPLDIESSIEERLRILHEHHNVAAIYCDPFQMHRSIMSLKAARLKIEEYNQTPNNLTLMGSTLFDLLKSKNIRLYRSDELREQALNTIAIESPRSWRIAKEKASKKVDSIVALAMARVAAVEGKPKKSLSPVWGRGGGNGEVTWPRRGAYVRNRYGHWVPEKKKK